MEFAPQKLFYLGAGVSIATFNGIFIYIGIKKAGGLSMKFGKRSKLV